MEKTVETQTVRTISTKTTTDIRLTYKELVNVLLESRYAELCSNGKIEIFMEHNYGERLEIDDYEQRLIVRVISEKTTVEEGPV